jgi:hypothetical protein
MAEHANACAAAVVPPAQQEDDDVQVASVSELVTTLSGYRPTFRLGALHPSASKSSVWKPYRVSHDEWTPGRVEEMYTELRSFVIRQYMSPQQLTGLETFSKTQELFGHFAVSQILLHDQVRFVPTKKRPFPPVPRALRQLFQLLERKPGNSHQKTIQRQPMHMPLHPTFRATTKRLRLVVDSTRPMFQLDSSCIPGCSAQDVRCNKYIIRYGLGVRLWTVLPNGQTVAAFSTQYVYHRHMNQMTLKRNARLQKASAASAAASESADATQASNTVEEQEEQRPSKRPRLDE